MITCPYDLPFDSDFLKVFYWLKPPQVGIHIHLLLFRETSSDQIKSSNLPVLSSSHPKSMQSLASCVLHQSLWGVAILEMTQRWLPSPRHFGVCKCTGFWPSSLEENQESGAMNGSVWDDARPVVEKKKQPVMARFAGSLRFCASAHFFGVGAVFTLGKPDLR